MRNFSLIPNPSLEEMVEELAAETKSILIEVEKLGNTEESGLLEHQLLQLAKGISQLKDVVVANNIAKASDTEVIDYGSGIRPFRN